MDSSVTLNQPKNYALSVEGGSEATTTLGDILNLTVSFTSNGDPVKVSIVGSGGAAGGLIRLISNNVYGDLTATLKILRDSSDSYARTFIIRSGEAQVLLPSLSYIETPAAGTYTYKVQAQKSNSNHTFAFDNLKLLVEQF